jgi:hypothetical protein
MDIEQYLMTNGYYSEIEIRKAAGVDDRAASFLAIFGSFDDDGQDDGGPLSRADWRKLVELGYATSLMDNGSEQGYPSVSYSLTERGQQLLDPSYSAPGLYADQVEG